MSAISMNSATINFLFFNALMFLQDDSKMPLQVVLRNLVLKNILKYLKIGSAHGLPMIPMRQKDRKTEQKEMKSLLKQLQLSKK